MSLHKLTAGSGYTYLTSQVAAHDRTGGARMPLATYYAEKGETPGQWIGSGMAGVDGLAAGDEVTAEQMQALFGQGLHPLAARFYNALAGPDVKDRDRAAVTKLGLPYKTFAGDVTGFQVEVARRIQVLADVAGDSTPVPLVEKARIRTEVALEWFRAETGRDPFDARELSSAVARLSRPRTTAIAGFDLTFSPVKSVSSLWAIAPTTVAAQIEMAHHDAVRDALAFIEKHALYSREGKNGVRQVDVTGLIATAFTHRDSRAGDPDLHTHVAVSNKVQTLNGKWLSIDGRLIYKAGVTASETYNTALEGHLRRRLGLTFADRPGSDRTRRPVREIVGVDPHLTRRWSSRRATIVSRTRELAAAFQLEQGRPPTVIESVHLAQQATLETRDAKHEPRTLQEQRTAWAAQAAEVLGGPTAVSAMVQRTLTTTTRETTQIFDQAWVSATADIVTTTVQSHRSTWQVWHVRAEAQRQVRSLGVTPHEAEFLVDRVTDHVLTISSIRLTRVDDGIPEPDSLLRRDGSSAYSVAGAAVYTSRDILAAEQRLLSVAGISDRPSASEDAVSLALLEHAANGATLNAAQSALVRAMATSGRRLQLALAPAGSGKTTAMTALATAWRESGGTVIGFAPSAAAAAVLRDHIDTTTDTLAKLTWSITHNDLPDWAHTIGPATLAIIDEAGLADTLTLDAAISFITARGGQVRLVGDHHQLSAIGAGGILHDIATTHGAVHLTELVRFADPAEGSASLALREGNCESLGFYFDEHRVHVGGLTTITNDAFEAWCADRQQGLDSLMVAPTRDLVRALNRRAQTHRLNEGPHGPGAALLDGSLAHVGDRIITRRNNRQLPISGTDWVKNGDRWTVEAVHPDRSLTVRQDSSARPVHLPAKYVAEFVELGYATTIHGAQGITVATLHGLATGTESRQQLYTMLTRGAVANHVYLQTAGDGDPHTVIRPENTRPPTATDLLETILGRDDQPVSATTLRADHDTAAVRLADAVGRYTDALHHAAEHHIGSRALSILDVEAERVLVGLTEEPAWPTLRSHLCLLATTGADAAATLRTAIAAREIDTADDRAAVIDCRLDDTTLTPEAPLPWLPGIPHSLREDPTWGPYLQRRAGLVTSLATDVANAAQDAAMQPDWAPSRRELPEDLLRDIVVWRAAHGIEDNDLRPTGPRLLPKAEGLWQRALTSRLGTDHGPATAEWTLRLHALVPSTAGDPYTPRLAQQLCEVARAGIDTHALLRTTTAAPLPDDHPAAALWWRISRHLTPAVAASLETPIPLKPAWALDLDRKLGPVRATAVQSSRWWPALVAATDHALAVGLPLEQVLDIAGSHDPSVDIDECQALVWRLSLLTDPAPADPPDNPPDPGAVEDLWIPPHTAPAAEPQRQAATDDQPVDLSPLILARSAMGVLDRSDAEIELEVARAAAWDDAPFTPQRAAHINAMACDYYEAHLNNAWASAYLSRRLRTTTLPAGAGYAPAGWTNVTNHLRQLGVTDGELLAVGISSRARTGRLIDRFRNRLVLPITAGSQVLGFVARRHPDADDEAGPKYLNTPATALFHKGDVLYGYDEQAVHAGATPVLVEGPLDALSINSASIGDFIGVAPLGTALTQTQARKLACAHTSPIVATDNDPSGRAAAERAFWLLAQHGTAPRTIDLPQGTDPSEILMLHGPAALTERLEGAHPLALDLIRHAAQSAHNSEEQAHYSAIIAASPSDTWPGLTNEASLALGIPRASLASSLAGSAKEWVRDPSRAAARAIQSQSHPRPSRTATVARVSETIVSTRR